MDHCAEIKEFLSSRRARLTPERAGLPVYVHAALDGLERPSSSIEGIAYYVVSECLANVAKHAPGASAWVMA